jgi:hypothetical protein
MVLCVAVLWRVDWVCWVCGLIHFLRDERCDTGGVTIAVYLRGQTIKK